MSGDALRQLASASRGPSALPAAFALSVAPTAPRARAAFGRGAAGARSDVVPTAAAAALDSAPLPLLAAAASLGSGMLATRRRRRGNPQLRQRVLRRQRVSLTEWALTKWAKVIHEEDDQMRRAQPVREEQLGVAPITEVVEDEIRTAQTVDVRGARATQGGALVEWIPGNARRIYATVDIAASVEDVWQVMTNYASLPDVIPNLKVCDVLERLPDGGATMWQIGKASLSLPGVRAASLTFEAGSTIRVELHPRGVPDAALHRAGGSLRDGGAPDPLVRGVFPQPPEEMTAGRAGEVREITMQNVEGARGDFRHYQAIWRLEPIGSAEGPAMRLSYASEVAPHWFMPVAPVEGQIAEALGENLLCIRDFVTRGSAAAAAGR